MVYKIVKKQDLDYYFPIKTNTACQSKWSWSTIWLDMGESSSCHRVDSFPIPINDFNSFHNLPQKIIHREKMLKGQWPGEGCEYCKDIEETGGFSDRMHNNDLPGYAPVELKDNPTLTHVKPTIVEIFAKNTCNFACTYCGPRLSSKIEQEMNRHDIHPLLFLLLINILILVLGCFLDATTIILVIVPLFIPACKALGIDLVHFGVLVVVNSMIGLITPPYGILLFVINAVTGIPIKEIIGEIWLFFGALILALITLIVSPDLVLWLPRMLGYSG